MMPPSNPLNSSQKKVAANAATSKSRKNDCKDTNANMGKMAAPKWKELTLQIEYNAPAQFKPFSMLQAHCEFMESLFNVDP